MISYATADEFYKFLNKYQNFVELTSIGKIHGDLKDYQNLFALDTILCKLSHNAKILEIGGGDCKMLTSLNGNYPKQYETWSLDPLKGKGGGPLLKDLEKKNKVHKNIKLVKKNIGDFSNEVPENFFDCIFSISVMEHLDLKKWKNCFKDMRRLLKKGGMCFHCIDVPIDYELSNLRIDLIAELGKNTIGFQLENRHVPTMHDIRKDISTYYVSPIIYYSWLKYMKNDKSNDRNKFKRITSINCIYVAV